MKTVLSAGTTFDESEEIEVDGAPVKVGLFVAGGSIPQDCAFNIMAMTPGEEKLVGHLGRAEATEYVLAGDGTYKVIRVSAGRAGTPVGVYTSEAGD